MRFHGYFRSSAAYRCRIAFNLKGVAPEFVSVHLRKGEQRAPRVSRPAIRRVWCRRSRPTGRAC